MVKSENYLPKSSSKSARQVVVQVVVQVFASHIFEIALGQASFAAGVW